MTFKTIKNYFSGFLLCFLGFLPTYATATPNFAKSFWANYQYEFSTVGKPHNLLQSVRYRPPRVREILRERGYRRIRFIDRELPVYVVEACKNGRKFRIRLNRWARIRDRDDIGSCRSRFDRDRENRDIDLNYDNNRSSWDTRPRERERLRPKQVRRLLRTRGFNRIRFTDRELPVYKVTACKHNRKMKLRINRRGRIIDRERMGRCRDQGQRRELPSLREIKGLLRQRGYHKIRYRDRELPRYKLTACRRGAEFDLILNRWGDIKRRNRSGWCRSFRDNSEPATPRVRFDDRELSDTTRIDADTCQNQLEYLIDRKKIYFSINSADVERDSHSLLRKIAHVMRRCPSVKIEVAGHTDSVGSRAYNHDLSHRRAYSVARELTDLGVRRGRLRPKGYGEDHPVVSNETNRGKAQNRRIDFIVAWEENDYADR